MTFTERKLKGVYEIIPNVVKDERGFFMKTYNMEEFKEYSLHKEWVQENHSGTIKKGTLRGFHIQVPPFSETKLIRCIRGSVLNVFVDLRKGSRTFGQWDAIELTSKNGKMVYLPKMFANSFCILEKDTELIYKSDNFYQSDYERGIIWNDSHLNIEWPFKDLILSEKDKKNGSFEILKSEIDRLGYE